MNITIRPVQLADAPALSKIYEPYVLNTAISFEYTPPDSAEFVRRIKEISQKYPYLVAEQAGVVVGYAYASQLKNRPAYDHCVELSIYLSPEKRKCGIGRQLYSSLMTSLHDMGIHNAYACIAHTDEADEYLNNASEDFHSHIGFTLCGKFHNCGYKFGRYYDVIWMEKFI